MKFTRLTKIRFKHCDKAGIVFYPRYFEMLNDLVEDWFEELGVPFHKMHEDDVNMGVPAAHIDCDFNRPSFLGDVISKQLKVEKVGGASCKLSVKFIGTEDTNVRVSFNLTIVCIDLMQKKSNYWDDALKNSMNKYK